jgi:hypothetical protein
MSWEIGTDHALAHLAATIAFADAAAGASSILLYTTPRPAAGAAPGAAHMAEVVLAKPCATIAGGVLTLHPADAAGAMLLSSGIPRWARWQRSDGVLVGDCNTTDALGGGDITVIGGATPDGDNSPMLYAGGRVLLGAVTLT